MNSSLPTLETVRRSHRQHLITNWNFQEVARILGVEPSMLWRQRQRDSEADGLLPAGFPVGVAGRVVDISGFYSYAEVEAAHIAWVLSLHKPLEAAKVLGIQRSTLLAKRKKYALNAPRRYRRGVA